MDYYLILAIALLMGFLADKFWGDPVSLPHPIVGFGKSIAFFEKRFNNGSSRRWKGALVALFLVFASGLFAWGICRLSLALHWSFCVAVTAVGVFYCLAGKTLIDEVRMVFEATDCSLEEGRRQVGRIVGRDVQSLSAQEVRAAALETLAENLSDGVVAPLFWYLLLGLPGMMMYKMINTLDSMIGYKNERYGEFGFFAAKLDDAVNYLPARITAFLMLTVCGQWRLFSFVRRYGREHLSPNSGYPEAALAGILNCRFGGPHDYFGVEVYKPYIGENERNFTTSDMHKATRINMRVELLCVLVIIGVELFFALY